MVLTKDNVKKQLRAYVSEIKQEIQAGGTCDDHSCLKKAWHMIRNVENLKQTFGTEVVKEVMEARLGAIVTKALLSTGETLDTRLMFLRKLQETFGLEVLKKVMQPRLDEIIDELLSYSLDCPDDSEPTFQILSELSTIFGVDTIRAKTCNPEFQPGKWDVPYDELNDFDDWQVKTPNSTYRSSDALMDLVKAERKKLLKAEKRKLLKAKK